jgi:hypothetical protein
MTTAEKKQRNRDYYLKNRERILHRAKERKSQRRGAYLEIVPPLKTESAEYELSKITVSDGAENFKSAKRVCFSDAADPKSVTENFEPSVSDDWIQASVRMVSASFTAAVQTETFSASEFMLGTKPEISDFSFNIQFEVAPMEQALKLAKILGDRSEPLSGSENKSQHRIPSKLIGSLGRTPIYFMLRLLFVASLTILMTAMQVAFYKDHDVLPGYAIPLAIASELAFVSLMTMKFKRGMEWVRVAIYIIFFGYFVGSLSFHVFIGVRAKTSSVSDQIVSSGDKGELENQLNEAKRLLGVATKGRSWKNMELFGKEVARINDMIRELPKADPLGASNSQVLALEAILLIALRALLMAASALNAIFLREQFRVVSRKENSVGDMLPSSDH